MTSAKKSFAHLVTRRWDGTDPGVTEAVQRFGREGEGRWGWGGDKQGLGSEDCGFSPSIATTKIAWGPNCNLRYPQLSISGLLLGKLGYAPTAEEVLRKVCQRDIASVPAKNGTSLSFSPPLGSNPRAGAAGGGREGPRENLAFKKKLPNQLARERRAPSSPAASSPCPLLASLPFSISLPSPPRQGVRQSEAGSGSPPSSPKIPPREPQSRGKDGVERVEEREQGVTGRAGAESSGRREHQRLGYLDSGQKNLSRINKGSLSAHRSFATPSKSKRMRDSFRGVSDRHLSGRQRVILVRVGERLLVSLLVGLLSTLKLSRGLLRGSQVR